MRNYDLTIITSLEEGTKTEQGVAELLRGEGGLVTKEERGKRIPLPSSMRKKGVTHKEGELLSLGFSLNPENLPVIEKKLKEDEHVLRFLVTTGSTRSLPSAGRMRPEFKQEEAPQGVPAQPVFSEPAISTEEKVELEDIERKLEEIFKEKP